ncbi:hypothetical protein [Tianweitania sediminis]|uniref:Uncharacterized protein n=1 Tax=Tianweitania sediminis TaxID=1502156 RepID=A0A8J7RL00_9HYPH|nr:hypothetical protein [Tianweitania sediminis]MBP0439131.1 hypothetical protein [Tianweitania sediminis]
MWHLRYDDPDYERKRKAEADRLRERHPFILSVPFDAVPLGWMTLLWRYADAVDGLLREHPEARYETLQIVSPEGAFAIRFAASADINAAVGSLAHRVSAVRSQTCDMCGGEGFAIVVDGQAAVRCPEDSESLGYRILWKGGGTT